MAVERVEKLCRDVCGALDRGGVPYALIGGNAVVAWVSTRDPDAIRTTKDVDLLLERGELERAGQAVRVLDMYLDYVGDIPVLLDIQNPSPKRGVHIVCASERVRRADSHPAPSISEATRLTEEGFRVIALPALLRMKLTAFRRHDQVHIEDMIRVGLITPEIRSQVPADLLPRLEEIERTLPDWH